jgi:hypothetical protein
MRCGAGLLRGVFDPPRSASSSTLEIERQDKSLHPRLAGNERRAHAQRRLIPFAYRTTATSRFQTVSLKPDSGFLSQDTPGLFEGQHPARKIRRGYGRSRYLLDEDGAAVLLLG